MHCLHTLVVHQKPAKVFTATATSGAILFVAMSTRWLQAPPDVGYIVPCVHAASVLDNAHEVVEQWLQGSNGGGQERPGGRNEREHKREYTKVGRKWSHSQACLSKQKSEGGAGGVLAGWRRLHRVFTMLMHPSFHTRQEPLVHR